MKSPDPSVLRAFLYRRLARWITCELRLLGSHPLALNSKYQVNSLQDVFCHPFYWQLYGWLPSPPKLVLDLGAHCGHFSMLADVCFRTQFVQSDPEYILIEPNPCLVQTMAANLQHSGLCRRHSIHQGLVGKRRTGSDTLWVCGRNFLSASLQRGPGTRAIEINYLDLDKLIGNRPIDLLKVDVEGAEFDLVQAYGGLFGRTRSLMIEIHDRSKQRLEPLCACLEQSGLRLRSQPLEHGEALLAMYQNF